MSETLVAQLQSLRDRIANDPRSAEMFEADCDVLLDAISRINADKLRQFVKDRASSTYTDRIAALEAELAQARADVVVAAGELLIEIPEPGTDMSKVMLANSQMRRERDKAREECERLRADVERMQYLETNAESVTGVGLNWQYQEGGAPEFTTTLSAAIDAARKEGT